VIPTESRKEGKFLDYRITACILIGPGRLVHVILVAVVRDKPAAHKIGGFASHSHTNFCTLCWISIQDKSKAVVFQKDGMSRPLD
jgi:hypothetical protein